MHWAAMRLPSAAAERTSLTSSATRQRDSSRFLVDQDIESSTLESPLTSCVVSNLAAMATSVGMGYGLA